jgi:hypothetical protein
MANIIVPIRIFLFIAHLPHQIDSQPPVRGQFHITTLSPLRQLKCSLCFPARQWVRQFSPVRSHYKKANPENSGFATFFGTLKSGDFMQKYALFEEKY